MRCSLEPLCLSACVLQEEGDAIAAVRKLRKNLTVARR
jgi:hypothetical protein